MRVAIVPPRFRGRCITLQRLADKKRTGFLDRWSNGRTFATCFASAARIRFRRAPIAACVALR
jgi:hypothetical protein